MDVPARTEAPTECSGVSEILNRVGDKWTVQVLVALRDQPRRFNGIKRQIGGISQQMLTRTLKMLERDGMVKRTVRPCTPPQVNYELTAFGRSLSETVKQLADWALKNRATIRENQQRYDANR